MVLNGFKHISLVKCGIYVCWLGVGICVLVRCGICVLVRCVDICVLVRCGDMCVG